MFGPKVRNEEIVSLENLPKAGGEFSYVVKRDGQTLKHIGRFLETGRPEKLRFTWGIEGMGGDNSTVQVVLQQDQGKTRLQLVHELPAALGAQAEQSRQGWSLRCDTLNAMLNRRSAQRSLLP